MRTKATTNKVTQSFTFLFVFVFLFTSVFGNNLIAKATDATESNTETGTIDTTTTDEENKKLVQESNSWFIYQYDDDPTNFDIMFYYQKPEDLVALGIQVQYRIIHISEDERKYFDWTNFGEPVSDDAKLLISELVIQFRAIQISSSWVLSTSECFALYDSPAPFVMSSYPENDEYYQTSSTNNKFTVRLKYNEHLYMDDNAYVAITHNKTDWPITGYSATNLKIENKTSTHTIEYKDYSIDYSIVTFDVEIPSSVTVESSNGSSNSTYSTINYLFNIVGVKSCTNHKPVEGFALKASTKTNYITPKKVYVESVEIVSSTSTIFGGESTQLSANVLPNNATNKTVIWWSSNTNYATVDQTGLVTTSKEGAGKTVTITATANDGSGVKANYTLSISKPEPVAPVNTDKKVTSIKIKGKSTTVKVGKTLKLTATVSPSDATNSDILWISGNGKFATVNQKGVVTAKKDGLGKTVIISALAKDGSGIKATYTIKIVKATVTKIKITASSKTVKAGGKVTLKVTVKPTYVTNKKVAWSSSNKKYATVNKKGIVKTKKAGAGKTVTITAKAKDGSGKKATIKVKIK